VKSRIDAAIDGALWGVVVALILFLAAEALR